MKSPQIKIDDPSIDHIQFTAIGLACHGLCLIESAGILNILLTDGKFSLQEIKKYKNRNLIKAALVTLTGAKVLDLVDEKFSLTELGLNLAQNIGTITLPFVGYRNLLSKQFELLQNSEEWEHSDIDYPAIALSSIDFGLHDLDPELLRLFSELKPKGTICDLGCGTAEKLVKICKSTHCPGLGIELSQEVIEESAQYIKDIGNIEVLQGDISALEGIWEDVQIAMISFVYHDMSNDKCVDFLLNLNQHFPNLQHLVVIDIVSLSEKYPTIMPGFDYVHGLQGQSPRTYEETIETFENGNFSIVEEIPIRNMPNTFIWLLTRK